MHIFMTVPYFSISLFPYFLSSSWRKTTVHGCRGTTHGAERQLKGKLTSGHQALEKGEIKLQMHHEFIDNLTTKKAKPLITLPFLFYLVDRIDSTFLLNSANLNGFWIKLLGPSFKISLTFMSFQKPDEISTLISELIRFNFL